jgi:hypothetical protein
MQISALNRATGNAATLALFDLLSPTSRCHKSRRPFHVESQGLDAAFRAFETYIALRDIQHQSLIAGVAAYALTPKGCAKALSPADLAPFYALNLLA